MTTLQRVVRTANPNYQRSGIKSYVHLMNKYKFEPTLAGPYFVRKAPRSKLRRAIYRRIGLSSRAQDLIQKRLDSGKTGKVSAEDQQNDSEYLCPVTIGTPGQTLNLDFDTGSADLWVFSTDLPSSTDTSKHVVYDAGKSSTAKAVSGSTWQISYGDGSSASGDVGTDTVTIGGLAIAEQTVEKAKQLSAEFASGAGDGLLGLAFDTINTVTPTPAKTPVDNLIAQGKDDAGVFTAYLGSWRDTNTADKGESFYTFGYIDQDVLKAANVTEPHYAPVDSSQGFWTFDSTSVTINGKAVERSGNTAIADTGTTLALVDDATCKAIYAAIPGSSYDNTNQGYVFPSTVKPADLPTVAFAVGDKSFTIPKESLAFADAGNGTVYGGVQSRGTLTFDILGDTFLKGVYAIFDVNQTRFGVVQRADQTGDTLAAPQK